MKTKKRKKQTAVEKEVARIKNEMQRYADWVEGNARAYELGLPEVPWVEEPEYYTGYGKECRDRRHYCNLANDILDDLEAIPQSKWFTAEPPAYHFHTDDCIDSIYTVPSGQEAKHMFQEPVHEQDVYCAWGYWPTNNQENRMKAITKFFNHPYSKGIKYFPLLSAKVRNRVKAVSAKYDTWWA